MQNRQWVKLRDVTENAGAFDLEKVLSHVASELKSAQVKANIGIVVCGKKKQNFVIDISNQSCKKLSSEAAKKKSSHTQNWVLIQESAIEDLARGLISPLTLLQRGDLRFTGQDSDFTAVLTALAAAPDSIIQPCIEEQ